jgi:hypothetical protein
MALHIAIAEAFLVAEICRLLTGTTITPPVRATSAVASEEASSTTTTS